KVSSVPDTGTKPARDADVSSSNPALDAIAGRYLMRWDTFGTANSGIGPLKVAIRSRVSLLFVTELVVEGDHLKATERLCNQTAKQKCEPQSCDSSSTVVDPRVIEGFLHKTTFTRDYVLGGDGRAITGGESTATLGYDGAGSIPTSSSDSKVWDVIPDKSPREGMLTSIKIVNVGNLGGPPIMCDVYGVQKFVTKFEGTLGGSSAAPTFPNMPLIFTPETAAGRLGSTNAACDAAGDSPLDKATVQLVRHGDSDGDAFWDCYGDDVFEQKIPATADDVIDAK
ncbi:MAG: hypothetical protein JWN48_4150, partial [Myxococcaceae bacterium]|nr:hypothetical protein [Myxococcaceae bacterium]